MSAALAGFGLFLGIVAIAAGPLVAQELRFRRERRAEQARREAWAEITADIFRERQP